ncbi:MAG TPA: triose-phosphate isomerase [Gemmatimonadaceae bacterium]|nr:triose-phosphate isomerase [Gemmatimonadaceae bacterium]
MQAPIFAANWKLNLGPTEARAFMQTFIAAYPARDDRTVMFFPSALAFAAARAAAGARADLWFGVQNIAAAEKGAFTGENSAPIARDAGATCVLVGHSERRHVFGETDQATADKCALALAHGLTPVLCVGETLDERQAGHTDSVVLRQLRVGVSKLAAAQLDQLVLAYEPVWAIGTGRNATPDDAAAVHTVLRSEVAKLGARMRVPILYGGSVSPANAASLLGADGVDGLLVGGASLNPESWQAVVNAG